MREVFELISIGTELTNGSTVNTNGYWLAKDIRKNGGIVNRITIINDELEQIETVLNEAIKRKPKYIVTTGGLGPTHDDKTAEGVARALGLKTKENKMIANMIKQKYNILDYTKQDQLIKFRLKMARIPERAELVLNNIGTAPGFILKKELSIIICLPGVPKEMKDMFRSIIKNINFQIHECVTNKEINYVIKNVTETSLMPLVKRIRTKYNKIHIYIKTHPHTKGKKNNIRLQIIIDHHKTKIKEIVSSIDKEIKVEIKKLERIPIKKYTTD